MGRSSNQKTRILALYKFLSDKSDEQHPVSTSEIISNLEISGYECERKTVYADIEALNNFGIEIIYTTYPKKGYFLASRGFEVSEISLLSDAVLSADFITPKKTDRLINKLRGFLSVYQANEYKNRAYISNRNKCENEEIFYNIDKIITAVSKGKKLSFYYFKHKLKNNHFIEQTSKKMTVSPYALVWADDRYYVVCNYEKYNNLLHLRLDRMRQAEICEEKFRHFSEVSEYKNEFNVSDYVEKAFNMYSGEKSGVTFKCELSVLEPIIDRFGEDIFVRSFDESHFVFDSNVLISEGFVSWLLSFGSSIEVIKPVELRERVRRSAEKILQNYS